MLDDLGQSGRQFTRWQGMQGGCIGDHGLRLIERADHVLAEGMIDTGLAAHRRVDLRQQRGRDLHERDAAHVGCCSEAGQIADDATTECDHGGLAITFFCQQDIEYLHQAGPGLLLLAIGQDDGGDLLASVFQ